MKNKSKKKKPLRNCDVGTVRQQSKRFARYCRHEIGRVIGVAFCCAECPLSKYSDCSLAWAQMPYEANEKGGEK